MESEVKLGGTERPEQHRCKECNYESDFKLGLFEHSKTHKLDSKLPSRNFECLTCTGCPFWTFSRLTRARHAASCTSGDVERTADDVFQCADCSYYTRQKSHFKRHRIAKHSCPQDIFWHRCTECPYQSKTKATLKKHALMHEDSAQIQWFNCHLCSFHTKRMYQLKLHLRKHFPKLAKWFFCQQSGCLYKTKERGNLNRHSLTHLDNDERIWYNCPKCPHRTVQKSHLKRHLLRHEGGRVDETRLRCEQCSYSSMFRDDLKVHMLKHAAEEEIKWFLCGHEGCGRKFKRSSALTQHMKVHDTTMELLKCDVCQFETKYKYSLDKHRWTHAAPEEITWYECSVCQYRAKHKWGLTKHMSVHASPDQIKWVYCDKCQFKAKHAHQVAKHMLVHADPDDIRWFHCDHCPYRSKYPNDLKKHVNVKHSDSGSIQWFQCPYCPHKSKQKSNLNSHIQYGHTSFEDIRWFVCDKCPFRTKRKHALAKHDATTHAGSSSTGTEVFVKEQAKTELELELE